VLRKTERRGDAVFQGEPRTKGKANMGLTWWHGGGEGERSVVSAFTGPRPIGGEKKIVYRG